MTARISVFLILESVAAPAGAGLALVGNENGGTVSLIDTARDEVVGEIKTGGKPRGMAIQASRKLAYGSDQPNNALLVIDLEQRAVAKKIDLGTSPEGVYISPDGSLIAAAVELTNRDRKSTRLNSSHGYISYAVFCLKKKKKIIKPRHTLQHEKQRRTTS